MLQEKAREQRFIAICMLGFVLFNFPVLALFNVSGTVLGIPVLYAYIFAAWALLIVLLALLAER
ncbi:MAG: hypothetical protein JF611_16980 [Betaproteobacteria bacterium]|jgi:hypothetical protein|nr:hypothetical protein [Betaproteobacteria bacterium]